MLSVGALAIGYMLMNLFNTKGNVSGDVCTTLFGSTSILTLSKEEVIVCIVFSVLVMVFFVLFYNRLFSFLVDDDETVGRSVAIAALTSSQGPALAAAKEHGDSDECNGFLEHD